jgi:hypothetical protein
MAATKNTPATANGTAKFTPHALVFDMELVAEVMRRKAAGESVGAIAKELEIGAGKAAMALLVGTEERKEINDPKRLAAAVAKDRRAGASWGVLAARYGITEGSAREAYVAATGEPWNSLDYRKPQS